MQKAIRVTAIAATALAGLSLILLLVSIPFQSVIAPLFIKSSEVIDRMPVFPLVPFIICLLQTICIALLIICCGNKKGGIWLELLIFVFLIIALPLFNELISYIQTVFIGKYGSDLMFAHSIVSQISSYCLIPSNLGQAIALLACGMSIAFKKVSKKQIAA